MCLGICCSFLRWIFFDYSFLGFGVYSLGIVWDFAFFTSAHLTRASVVYNMYTHTYTQHTHACMHTYTQQDTHIHTCMHTYIHCIHTQTCMHAHTHSQTWTHTYPHPYCLSKLKVNRLQVPGPIFFLLILHPTALETSPEPKGLKHQESACTFIALSLWKS